MKQNRQKSIFAGAIALLLIFSSGIAYSQCTEIVWPESGEMKAKAEESKVLYEDAIKTGQIAELKRALTPYNWMLTNVPNHHISLYIQGIDLFDKLATLEKTPAKRKGYIDSLMLVYDLRVKNCGDEANVINRKALSFVKFNANEKPVETLQILDKALELNGNNILESTIVPYMHVVRLNYLNIKKMSDEEVIQRYDKLVAVVDAKIQKAQSEGKPVDKLQKIKGDLEELLIQTVKIDCNFVRKNYGPKFQQNPKDIDLAKKIFTFMLKDKCTDDPLWLQAAEAVHAVETNCGLAKNLGIIYLAKENYEKAEKFLKESQGICEGTDKADVLFYLASLEARRNKSTARDMFRQVLSLDNSRAKDVNEKIGDLYLSSFETCKKLVSKVEDRLVFLIAYDYYAKAGDTRKMAMAKDNFPSKEEIFTENITAGSTATVKCWINENTTIRTRD
jgi:tetratricopeptide (TPR) repeat protein